MHQLDSQSKKIRVYGQKRTTPLKDLTAITLKLLVVKAIVTALALAVIYGLFQFAFNTRLSYGQLEMLGNIIFMILFLHEVLVLGLEPYLKRKADHSRDKECQEVLNGFNLKVGYVFDRLPDYTNLDDPTVNPSLTTAYNGLRQNSKSFILLDFKDQPVSVVRIKQENGTLSEPFKLMLVPADNGKNPE